MDPEQAKKFENKQKMMAAYQNAVDIIRMYFRGTVDKFLIQLNSLIVFYF